MRQHVGRAVPSPLAPPAVASPLATRARGRTAWLMAAVVAGLLAGGLAVPSSALAGPEDEKRRVDASIEQLKGHLHDTSEDLSSAYAALQQTRSQLPAAQARLAKAERAEAAAHDRDVELGRRLAVSKQAEAKAVAAIAAAEHDADAVSSVLGSIARQAYRSSGMGELSVALQAQSADDFATRVVLVDTAMRIQGDALARLAVVRADSAAARARLAAVRRQNALLKAQAAAALVEAQQAADAAAAAKAAVDELLATQQRQAGVVEQRKQTETRRLSALQVQSKKLQAQLAEIARQARLKAARDRAAKAAAEARARAAAAARARAAARAKAERAKAQRAKAAKNGSSNGSSTTPADPSPGPAASGFTSSGYLTTPVRGAWVSSEFGMRFHPILHYWRLHAGIDFAASCGSPLYAADAGRVLSAGWGGGYGNRIVVDHGLIGDVGLATTYNHLSSIVVHGGSVRRGQLIGYSGTTGSSTGCHLHFETYENGVPVNPRRWL